MSESQNQQDLLKRISGLYDVDDKGKLTLNEAKVKELNDLTTLQNERYARALRGELPVSEGTIQKKAKDWALLKENAARRGIVIEGESPDAATSASTTGNELIGQFQRSYKLQEDAERRGELASVGGPASLPLMGASMSQGPASLMGAYGGLSSGYGEIADAYKRSRELAYQGQLAAFGYNQQSRGNILGAGLSGAATGAAVGGPWGAAIGGGLGIGAALLGR